MNSIIHVASKHNPVMIMEDRNMLNVQREEKLRRQTFMKDKRLEKTEKSHIEAMLWHQRHNHLKWKTVREVTTKLNKIHGKQIS